MPPVGKPPKRELKAFSAENKEEEVCCRDLSAFSMASESFRKVSLAKRIVREISCEGLSAFSMALDSFRKVFLAKRIVREISCEGLLGVLFEFSCMHEVCLFILKSVL